jgi:hypothetical protein
MNDAVGYGSPPVISPCKLQLTDEQVADISVPHCKYGLINSEKMLIFLRKVQYIPHLDLLLNICATGFSLGYSSTAPSHRDDEGQWHHCAPCALEHRVSIDRFPASPHLGPRD